MSTTASTFARFVRAGAQWLMRGHVVSGGSTLPMQVARLIEPRPERTIAAKLRQIARGARDRARRRQGRERSTVYLTLAPFGGNLEGVRAASLAYFGKEPQRLTLAEAALLVALPQSPEARRPDRSPRLARARARPCARPRRRARPDQRGRRRSGEARAGPGRRAWPSRRSPRMPPKKRSPPTAERKSSGLPSTRGCRRSSRRSAEESVARLGPKLRPRSSSSTMRAGEVRARVGSAGLRRCLARRRDRHVARAALAGLGAETLHLCAGVRAGPRPSRDAPVRPADALRGLRAGEFQSRLPGRGDGAQGAADVAQPSCGRASVRRRPGHFLARLHSAGAEIALPKDTPIGLAIGLGGLGISLTDLARLYAGLARGGEAPPLIERLDGQPPASASGASTEPVAAWYVARHPARRAAARQRAQGPDRLQDRHVLRLSATRWRSASTGGPRSRSGSGGRTMARRRASSAARPRRRSCSTLSSGSAGASSRSRPRRACLRATHHRRSAAAACGACARTRRRASPRRRRRRSRSPSRRTARASTSASRTARGSSARLEGAGRRAAVHLVRQRRAGRRSRDPAPDRPGSRTARASRACPSPTPKARRTP